MTRLQKHVRWIVCAGAGLLICAAVVLYERASYTDYELLRLLCDGCYVAGVMLIGAGALTWIANFGGFSAFSYAWYLIKRTRFSSQSDFKKRLSYLEYVQTYEEKKKNKHGHMIITGVVFVAAACIFLCFYWK